MPLALASKYMDIEVRQLIYKKQYRILLTIHQADGEDLGIVRIHRVLHGTKERLRDSTQLFGSEKSPKAHVSQAASFITR
ncbi:MAG: hypothetical protein AAGF01_08985 [Cyanobacteria bacterium P01_G01_bin.38]